MRVPAEQGIQDETYSGGTPGNNSGENPGRSQRRTRLNNPG